ncbi:DUF2244 domain-containing protein [Litorivivens sp.]|uniref:DUF2244 domain-containing protein n=1 Tax=Litorivivens sp. TaxID=2020868 RepID=UPI0035659D0F
MIELQACDSGHCLILKPNRSADWQTNQRLIVAVALISIVIASAFAAIGAWLILPFAGLEVMALGAALYRVNLNLHYRQILWFSGESLIIEKGVYRPRQRWRWTRIDTAIHVCEDNRLILKLSNGSNSISIGEFLTEEDLRQVLSTLKTLGLRVRGHSSDCQLNA